jgi:hypothetical protein
MPHEARKLLSDMAEAADCITEWRIIQDKLPVLRRELVAASAFVAGKDSISKNDCGRTCGIHQMD